MYVFIPSVEQFVRNQCRYQDTDNMPAR